MRKETNKEPGAVKKTDFTQPVPVYCNPGAGSSEKVIGEMRNDSRIQLEEVSPVKMTEIIQDAVKKGTKRVLISGGDGTIALAASILAGKTTELAIVPSGTLNHFAQRTGIPVNVDEAINVALNCKAYPVDVGYVNNSLFLNTSSVGAYSVFVRSRNYLENRMHYLPASIIAGIRRLLKFRLVRVRLPNKQLRTPLVFIGVGERELSLPLLGQAKKHGHSGLHFIAVDCHSKTEVFSLVIKAIFWGVDPMTKETSVENKLVNDIELNFRRRKRKVTVALDGELSRLRAPLRYRYAPGEILVALPDNNIT
ncbi:diacylglycerol kinase family protein [Desulfogranum marinum]|uniref:diacylglycerol/lipid kinase family protein n=1 Tax=Desulfogranum marinum TaxID=453220 RepID=UPI0029C98332|nr:diacylglycerol kinase family protein [Desulfogranum marinum]